MKLQQIFGLVNRRFLPADETRYDNPTYHLAPPVIPEWFRGRMERVAA